jgi:hypothetical protein
VVLQLLRVWRRPGRPRRPRQGRRRVHQPADVGPDVHRARPLHAPDHPAAALQPGHGPGGRRAGWGGVARCAAPPRCPTVPRPGSPPALHCSTSTPPPRQNLDVSSRTTPPPENEEIAHSTCTGPAPRCAPSPSSLTPHPHPPRPTLYQIALHNVYWTNPALRAITFITSIKYYLGADKTGVERQELVARCGSLFGSSFPAAARGLAACSRRAGRAHAVPQLCRQPKRPPLPPLTPPPPPPGPPRLEPRQRLPGRQLPHRCRPRGVRGHRRRGDPVPAARGPGACSEGRGWGRMGGGPRARCPSLQPHSRAHHGTTPLQPPAPQVIGEWLPSRCDREEKTDVEGLLLKVRAGAPPLLRTAAPPPLWGASKGLDPPAAPSHSSPPPWGLNPNLHTNPPLPPPGAQGVLRRPPVVPRGALLQEHRAGGAVRLQLHRRPLGGSTACGGSPAAGPRAALLYLQLPAPAWRRRRRRRARGGGVRARARPRGPRALMPAPRAAPPRALALDTNKPPAAL